MKPEELLIHARFVKSLAYGLAMDEHHAGDIEQQTWLAAIEHPPKEGVPIRSWLSQVTRNFARLMYRRDARRHKYERNSTGSVPPLSPEEILIKGETGKRLIEMVLSLNEPYRTPILYRYYEEMPPREIAKRMGIPVATVRTQLKRALALLREKLNVEHEGNRERWMLNLAPLAGLHTSATTASVATGSSIGLTGVIAMSTKFKIVLAAILILSLGIALTVLLDLNGDNALETNESTSSRSEAEALLGVVTDERATGLGTNDDKIPIPPSNFEVELTGILLSREDKTPISDAQVAVTGLPQNGNITCSKTLTNSEGRFLLDFPLVKEAPLSGFHIEFQANEYRAFRTYVPFGVGITNLNCGEFILTPINSYSLRVIDEQNNPIPGAEILVYQDSSSGPVVKKTANPNGEAIITDGEVELKPTYGLRGTTLHVSSPNMSDYFYNCNMHDASPIPDVVVMKPAQVQVGKVAEVDTRKPISGATVQLFTQNPALKTISDRFKTVSDKDGTFEIPHITWISKTRLRIRQFSIIAWAKDYDRSTVSGPDFQGLILMRKIEEHLTCRAIRQDTGHPLPNTKLQVMDRSDYVTDEFGLFFLSASRKNVLSHFFSVYSPDLNLFHRGKLEFDPEKGGILDVPLRPVSFSDLYILVEDELGRPVPGVRSQFYYYKGKGNVGYFCRTDSLGRGHFSFRVSETREATITFSRSGYCGYKTERFILSDSTKIGKQDNPMRFVLSTGSQFQNIQVIDGDGEPLSDRSVIAELEMEDYSTKTVHGHTDQNGLCEMSLPLFRKGTLHVRDRPDSIINFDYEAVLRQDKITLVLHNEMSPEHLIEGIVVDEAGAPIEGVLVSPSVSEGSYQFFDRMKTDKAGHFQFPAFNDRLYSLDVINHYADGKWYIAEPQVGLNAGIRLTVKMKAWCATQVDIFPLRRETGFRKLEYDSWLESEDGQRIVPAYTLDYHGPFFLGLPDGRMRAVVQTKDGNRYQTGMFEIKNGMAPQSVKIEI